MVYRIRSIWPAVLGVGSLVLLWAVASYPELINPTALPRPELVVAAIADVLGDGDYLSGLGDTLWTWLLVLTLTTAVAVPIGVLISATPALSRAAMVCVDAARSVPSTAMIPIAILIFGLGQQMKLAVAFYAILWPLLINTVYGLASTDPKRIDAARSLRWGWARRQVYVTVPSALPSILTGIRVASGIALVVIVSAEFLGASTGVGVVIVQYQQAHRADIVYAGVLLVAAIGALLHAALIRAERRIVRWIPVE
ncbi:ABC transporter permease [Micromonospora sp. NPDC049900]